MAHILDTEESSASIADIIKEAEVGISLVCPYLKIGRRLMRQIKAASSRGVSILVIYGKKKDYDSETRDFLESLDPIMVCYLQDLHAKFYMNESKAVVTSMNLYEYSQVYNEEIGTEFTAEEDPEDFEKIVERFLSLVEASECVYSSPSVDQVISKQESDDNCGLIPEDMECHCIRCGVILPHDQSTVYCDRCMRTWMKYLNPDYVEKDGVCFVCGKDFRSSARHPACPKCARLHQELVDDFSYWMGLIPENESLVRHYS